MGAENVYSSEVEGVLHSHEAVHQAAVFGIPNSVLGEVVAAAVVLRPGAPAVTEESLKEWCDLRLAYFKRPVEIRILASMPITGSGKILKTKLRELFKEGKLQAPKETTTATVDSTKISEMRALLCIDDDQPIALHHTNIILAPRSHTAAPQVDTTVPWWLF